MLRDKYLDFLRAFIASSCHPCRLEKRVPRRDVRIKPGRRAGHGIRRHYGIICQPVLYAVRLGKIADALEVTGIVFAVGGFFVDAIEELVTRRPQIRAAGASSIVAAARRRRARVKVLRLREALPDQLRADYLAACFDQAERNRQRGVATP